MTTNGEKKNSQTLTGPIFYEEETSMQGAQVNVGGFISRSLCRSSNNASVNSSSTHLPGY